MSTKKGISSLDYSQKKISNIPKEVLKNKDTLITLDISGNNFKDFNSIIEDLKQLKKLKNLKINIYTQEQAKNLIDAMPNLEYLNDEPINEEINSDKAEEEIVINIPLVKLVDIEFEPVFQKLNEFYIMNKTKEDNFQKLIEEFNNFGKKIKNSKNNNNKDESNSNKTMKLYTFLNNKLNKIKEEANNKNNKYNQKSLALLSSVIEENNKIKNKFNKSKTKQKESEIKLDKDKENGNEKDTTDENNSNNEKLTRNKNNQKNKNKNIKQNSFKPKQKTDNNYNSPSLEKRQSKDSNKIKQKEKDKNSKKLSKYPSSYGEFSPKNNANNIFIANLPQQKKNDTLWSNRSFNKINEKLKSPIDSARKAQNHHGTISEKKKSKHVFLSINQRKKYKDQADLIENYNDPNITDLLMKNKANYNILNIFDDDSNEQISKDKLNTRVINLNNLLEIINQIYKIRNSRVEKQKDGVYNKGTLEQDLYTYLKSKYGLKNLIVEWNINILSAIQTYIKLNGEVYLFALILRNELDEESIEIMNKIKKTVNNILYLIYDYDTNMVENVKNNKEFLRENEWKTISKCLYSDDDNLREKFVNKIINYIDKLMKGQDLMAKTGKKILLSDYMNILIFFNLKLRKKYLHNIFVLFSQQDKKRTGIINPESFKTIIKSCGIITDEEKVEEVANDLIEIADKEGSGQITFNDMVQCLDNLDLIMDEGKVKFLDKLSKMNL